MLNNWRKVNFALLCRIHTAARLEALRKELRFQNIDAFLIPSGDSHQENTATLLHYPFG